MKVALPGKLINSEKDLCSLHAKKEHIIMLWCYTPHDSLTINRDAGIACFEIVMIDVQCKYIIETAEFWLRVGKLAHPKEHRSQWLW